MQDGRYPVLMLGGRVQETFFFVLQNIQNGVAAQPASYLMGTDRFSRDKTDWAWS